MNGVNPISILAAAFLLAAPSPGAKAATPAGRQARMLLDQLPLYFEPNRGQWEDHVLFGSRAPEYMLYLTRDAAVLQTGAGVLEMRLAGGLPPARVEPLERRRSFSSHFVGGRKNWLPQVEHYSKVRYAGVYPGIDLLYYGRGRELEHDFVVAPGADHSAIRILFGGAEGIDIDQEGGLTVAIGGSALSFSAPYAYQRSAAGERVRVSARYVLTGPNEAGFILGEYDTSRELVIDPVLMYSTHFGGTRWEEGNLVAVDASGYIWISGQTRSTDFPTNGEGLQAGGGGGANVFLTKLDPFAPAGQGLLYSSFFGGAQDERPAALKIDAAGNIYIAGTTRSGDFPTTSNAVQATVPTQDTSVPDSSPENGFLVRFQLDATPFLKYGTYLGGDARDRVLGMEIDGAGRAYVVGQSSAAAGFPLSANPLQASTRGGGDAFFTIVDTIGGGLVYSTFLGGTSSDWASGVAIAGEGEAFVTGFTASEDFPIFGVPYSTVPLGGGDAFLTRIDWTKPGLEALGVSGYFGGTDLDVAQGILRNAAGRYHIVGYTLSADLPTTAAAVQHELAGNADLFLATLDPAQPGGEGLVYSSYLGGSGGDVPLQMSFDSAGGLVIAGYTLSPDFPIRGDAFDDSFGGVADAFYLRFDATLPDGQGLTCSTFLGGAGSDVAWGMAVDRLDNVYVVGGTMSRDFPVTPNAQLGERRARAGAFVSKFGPCAAPDAQPGGDEGAPAGRSEGRGTGRVSRGGGRGR